MKMSISFPRVLLSQSTEPFSLSKTRYVAGFDNNKQTIFLRGPDIIMPPTLIGGGIKPCFCLTSDVCLSDVCLSVAYIGPNSRTERPMKTKIGTEVAHVTRDSDTTFRVKRSKVNLLLNADVLNSQHAGTGATWRINTKILSTCRGRRHIVSPRAQLVCTSNPHRFSLWKTYAGNQAC